MVGESESCRKRITVVGAGTMGYSLALAYALGNYEVTLVSRRESTLRKALDQMNDAVSLLGRCDALNNQEAQSVLRRISLTTDTRKGFEHPDFLLEAVYEDPASKRQVFERADTECPPETIFMSTTSYLDIFSHVTVNRRDRLLITHWYAPAHIIPLVEVVAGDSTAEEVIGVVMESLAEIGKVPIRLKKYIPGFIVNRIQYLVSQEMFWLVENGYVSIEDVDRAVKASLAIRMPILGVLQSCDFTGLDTIFRARSNTRIVPRWEPEPPRIVAEAIVRGDLGVKTGKGLYDYQGFSPRQILEWRDENLIRLVRTIQSIGSLGTAMRDLGEER